MSGEPEMSEELELLEKRVTQLEQEVLQLKSNASNGSSQPWWQRIAGRFENDPVYDEIVRLGREYRQAQLPEDD
jgi:hypothetical protein